jgi:hypothetical protein
MLAAKRPVVVSTRVSVNDRARIRALAELEGVSVCQAVHDLLMKSVAARLADLVTERAQEVK